MVSKTWETMKDLVPHGPHFLPDDYPDLSEKVALVTGASSGIGYEISKALLKQNCTVLFLTRDPRKTRKAIEIIKATLIKSNLHFTNDELNSRIFVIEIDLNDLRTIKPAVREIEYLVDKIDYTFLNASVVNPSNGSMSRQGYELHIGINVLGHHLLQKLIHPLIEAAAEDPFSSPRVIWVTSSAHWSSPRNGGIKFHKLRDAEKTESAESYGQSKVCNIYQAYIYGAQYQDSNIISLGVHPGYLSSEITSHNTGMVKRKCKNAALYHPLYGAYTELFAALHPNITTEDNGRYIGPGGQFRDLRPDIQKGFTNGTAQKLWNWAEDQVKPYI